VTKNRIHNPHPCFSLVTRALNFDTLASRQIDCLISCPFAGAESGTTSWIWDGFALGNIESNVRSVAEVLTLCCGYTFFGAGHAASGFSARCARVHPPVEGISASSSASSSNLRRLLGRRLSACFSNAPPVNTVFGAVSGMECTHRNSSRGRHLVLVCTASALLRNLSLYCCCNLLGDFILIQKVNFLLCRVDIHVKILWIDCDAGHPSERQLGTKGYSGRTSDRQKGTPLWAGSRNIPIQSPS